MMKVKIILAMMVSLGTICMFAQQNTTTKRKKIYCFLSNDINKNVSNKDTLVFIKGMDRQKASINLKSTSQFVIDYHVVLDTVVKRMSDGSYVEKIVAKSDQINGFWKSKDPVTQVELIFNDDVINDYDIKEEGERIYFIKR
ncbi:hypothetical protein [Saccharicrinis fermentans]|uniref:Uncharacterized protein n=1 Tax=Saccharicrinis fermentans DSM 9555 = JCM 21142 TaxID=869213 RepID=W7XUB8_9BACT|nr:hypothetical protein [Saccharicrinis fermentans]GAF01595.1 hypothetical protein JCM21142_207 [Saccharicrinis fermentans DSM 9555 = JCM 21142]